MRFVVAAMGQRLASFNIVPTGHGSGSQLGIEVGDGPTCRETRFARQTDARILFGSYVIYGARESGVCNRPPQSQRQHSTLTPLVLSAWLPKLNTASLGQRPAPLLSRTPTTGSLNCAPLLGSPATRCAARAVLGTLACDSRSQPAC